MDMDILFCLKEQMSELVEAPNSFYINASQFNATDVPVGAVIKIEDRQDILKRAQGWLCNVVRWTIDTQSSLFYLKADPTATVSMELFEYTFATHAHAAQSTIIETRTFTLDQPQATLASFLAPAAEARSLRSIYVK